MSSPIYQTLLLKSIFACSVIVGYMSVAYAEGCPFAGGQCPDHRWKIIIGGQFSRETPTMEYQEKQGSPPRKIDIDESFADDRYLPFPLINISYVIDAKSSIHFNYYHDQTETSALERKRVQVFFIPVTIGIRTPLEISTESARLKYTRALYQTEHFKAGFTAGGQLLDIKVKAQIPITGEENERVTALLPSVGAYAQYSPSEKWMLLAGIDFVPLKASSLDGSVAEANVALEYRYNQHWLLGAGYAYHHLDVHLDKKKYMADVTLDTYGPTFFTGYTF